MNHLTSRLLLYKIFIAVFHYLQTVWQPTETVFTHGLEAPARSEICMLLFTTMLYYLHSKERSGAKLTSR